MVSYESVLEQCKKAGKLPGFAISSMPVPVFEAFMININECYNGVYWAKLNDLLRKAEAYDAFVQLGMLPSQKEGVVEKEENHEEHVTFRD
jgi:hypothetical protein